MDIHYFDSPLGTIKVKGDVAGVQEVCFEECNLEQKNSSVPNSLIPCVKQLEEYFHGERHAFDLDLIPFV